MVTVFRLPLRVTSWERVGHWHPKYVLHVEPVMGDKPLMRAIAGLGQNPYRMEATITIGERLWLDMTGQKLFRFYDKSPKNGVEMRLESEAATATSLPTPRSLEMHLAEVNGNSYAPSNAGNWEDYLVIIRSPRNELAEARLVDTHGLLVRIDKETHDALKGKLPSRCYFEASFELR